MSISALKERVTYYLYERQKLGNPSLKQLIFAEKAIAEETDCSPTNLKTILGSLQTDGIIDSISIGYVPISVMPTSHAVMSSEKSYDYPNIGYKIEVNKQKIEKLGSRLESKFQEESERETVEYNPLTGVVRHGMKIYKFHRGRKRALLFQKLWENHKLIKRGREIIKGESLTSEAYAVQINLIESSRDYNRKKSTQTTFLSLIKEINRNLKDKKIPAHIVQENGIQLVITE